MSSTGGVQFTGLAHHLLDLGDVLLLKLDLLAGVRSHLVLAVSGDVAGSVIYATAWVSVAYLIGDQAAELLNRFGGARVLLLIGPAAFAALLAYRLWRGHRYGGAQGSGLAAMTCESLSAKAGALASP